MKKQVITGVIIGLLVLILFAIGATLIRHDKNIELLNREYSLLRDELNQTVTRLTGNAQNIMMETQSTSEVNPSALITIIEEQQRIHVKESYGELAHQCFSEDDLSTFKENNIPDVIVTELKRDNRFIDVVLAIKKANPTDRQKLFKAALETRRPTWEEQGGINPKGQTETGKQAEMMIAKAIVDSVRDLFKKPVKDIVALYTD
jgi:hypothetical protein